MRAVVGLPAAVGRERIGEQVGADRPELLAQAAHAEVEVAGHAALVGGEGLEPAVGPDRGSRTRRPACPWRRCVTILCIARGVELEVPAARVAHLAELVPAQVERVAAVDRVGDHEHRRPEAVPPQDRVGVAVAVELAVVERDQDRPRRAGPSPSRPGTSRTARREIGWKPACLSIAICSRERARRDRVLAVDPPGRCRGRRAPARRRGTSAAARTSRAAPGSARWPGRATVSRFSHRRLNESCDSARAGRHERRSGRSTAAGAGARTPTSAWRLSALQEAHDATSAGWAARVPQDRVRDVRIA